MNALDSISGHRKAGNSGGAGFSLAEVAVVIGVIGILAALATPMFLRYLNTAQLTVAARQLVSTLNHGRQLAISRNGPVCVHISSTAVHYHVGACSATVETPSAAPNDGGYWRGAGTDATGKIAMPAGFTLTSSANPQFTYLGAASPGATYTVRQTQTGTTLTVTVAGSGRITAP